MNVRSSPGSRRSGALAWVVGVGLSCGGPVLAAQGDFQGSTHLVELETEARRYSKEPATGPVAELIRKIEAGKVTLAWDAKLGWLPSFQKALGVDPSSQTLVFSKTSLQREHIHPGNPRAVFFNDDVYLGYIPGSPLVEVSEVDPRLGGVFYVVEQKPTDKPVIKPIVRGRWAFRDTSSARWRPTGRVSSIWPPGSSRSITAPRWRTGGAGGT